AATRRRTSAWASARSRPPWARWPTWPVRGWPMRRRSAGRALALVGLLALPAAARADGAFPDSMSIFLPPGRPHEMLVATTFGLLVSVDDGRRWELVCEEAVTNSGETVSGYQ